MDECFTFDTRLGLRQPVKHMHSKPQQDSTSNTLRAAATDGRASAAVLCRLESLLSCSGEMSLAVLGGEQWGMEGGRQRETWVWELGYSKGRRRSGDGGGVSLRGTRAFVFLFHLWRGGKGGETWERHTAGSFGRAAAEVQESAMQCYKTLPSLPATWPLRAGVEMLNKQGNVTCRTGRQPKRKEHSSHTSKTDCSLIGLQKGILDWWQNVYQRVGPKHDRISVSLNINHKSLLFWNPVCWNLPAIKGLMDALLS